MKNMSIKSHLKFIENADFQTDFQNSQKQLIALLFPTHGFMPPWSMIKFLFKLPFQKNTPVLIIATRGEIRIRQLAIPGAAGFANFFAALILLIKGYDVRGFISLDMAANMNNLHPSLTPDSIKNIAKKSQRRVLGFISKIVAGQRVLFTLNNAYEAIWTILLFWFIPIFPVLYLIYGKTTMAKIMFANNNCVSCGRCARFCPSKAIEMKHFFGKRRPFWTYHCENCMRCMGYCKKKAVEAGHSWALLQYFVVTIPVIAYTISGLTSATGYSIEIKSYWNMILLESLYFLPALFISYWLFWMFIRIPVINRFFSVTTLTHYFRRYHEPDTSLKDLRTTKEVKGFNIDKSSG